MEVLVIEDNRDFAQIISDILETKGCRPSVAYSASIGLDIARRIKPQIIFCDIVLAGDMNGHDFAREVRGNPDLCDIPLVAISGYVSEEEKQLALEAGFDMLFPKPVKFADLSRAVETFARRNTA